MKGVFRKYYNSVLSHEEFSVVSRFITKKKNSSSVSGLMKSFWRKEMEQEDVAPRSNPELLRRIREAIALDKQKRFHRKLRIYQWALSTAAVAIVALVLSNVFVFKCEQNNISEQKISTPYGARVEYTLPDGSLVWLNSGSSLSFPAQFGKRRDVKLIGEAFFKVVKNDKPFIVSTMYGDVQVKGTSFNVSAYSDDNDFATTLVEGCVAFKAKESGSEVVLKPGEQISKKETEFVIKKVETKYFTKWKDGKLCFSREPFPSFVKKLERWYNVKIEYKDPQLNEIWYTGSIEMESISEVMEMVRKAAPVAYSYDNENRVFIITAK